jgi:Flp pilus assembly protein protease CpaA
MFFTNGYEVRWLWGLITFLGLLAAGTVLDLGGGDIKLITSLILFGDIEFSLIDYLGISMAVALLHILIDYARKGCVSGNIALAPTICVPMLLSLAAG